MAMLGRRMTEPTAAALIAEHFELDDYMAAETKKFGEFLKPFKERDEAIKNALLALLIEQGGKGIKTEHGTAYTSTIVTPKITARDSFLDWCLENWDTLGNEMLQLGAPQKDAVTQYQETNEGKLPPGVETSSFTRVNIRRS